MTHTQFTIIMKTKIAKSILYIFLKKSNMNLFKEPKFASAKFNCENYTSRSILPLRTLVYNIQFKI